MAKTGPEVTPFQCCNGQVFREGFTGRKHRRARLSFLIFEVHGGVVLEDDFTTRVAFCFQRRLGSGHGFSIVFDFSSM